MLAAGVVVQVRPAGRAAELPGNSATTSTPTVFAAFGSRPRQYSTSSRPRTSQKSTAPSATSRLSCLPSAGTVSPAGRPTTATAMPVTASVVFDTVAVSRAVSPSANSVRSSFTASVTGGSAAVGGWTVRAVQPRVAGTACLSVVSAVSSTGWPGREQGVGVRHVQGERAGGVGADAAVATTLPATDSRSSPPSGSAVLRRACSTSALRASTVAWVAPNAPPLCRLPTRKPTAFATGPANRSGLSAFSQPRTARAVVSVSRSSPPLPVMVAAAPGTPPSVACLAATACSSFTPSAVRPRLRAALATRAATYGSPVCFSRASSSVSRSDLAPVRSASLTAHTT